MHEAIIWVMVIMSHLIISLVSNLGSIIAAPEWRVQCIKKIQILLNELYMALMQLLFFEVIDVSYF